MPPSGCSTAIQEAPERVGTDLAEKFLRTPNLPAVTSQIDPLGLVQVSRRQLRPSKPTIRAWSASRTSSSAPARSRASSCSTTSPGSPFGWSPDTVRYMVAALLVAGEIKLKVSGREVTVTGQQAIDALKTNNAFKSVGVALRDDRPSMEVLARAAERLTDLSGEQVVPLEEDIGKAAQKLLPSLQYRLAPLAERLQALGLPGVETVRSVNEQIADMLLSDASDAPQRFGAEQSALYDGLKWAMAAKVAFDQGIGETVKRLRDLESGIADLPGTGVPKDLREAVREDLDAVTDMLSQEDFFKRKADLSTRRTAIEGRVADAVAAMRASQSERVLAAEGELLLLPNGRNSPLRSRPARSAEIQALAIDVASDIGRAETAGVAPVRY